MKRNLDMYLEFIPKLKIDFSPNLRKLHQLEQENFSERENPITL